MLSDNLQREQKAPPFPVIVGASRSGTTLLRLMLDAHELLAIPAETSLPANFFESCMNGTIQDAGDFVRRLVTWRKWFDLGTEPSEFLRELERHSPFNAADAFRFFFRFYAMRHGKVRGGDKSPGYVHYMANVQAVLPEAHFIHLIRDGRDVAISHFESRWGLWSPENPSMEAIANHWANAVTRGRDWGKGRPNYLEIRYEDLVRSPETQLRNICAFVDIQFSPKMLEFYKRAPERLKEIQPRRRFDGSWQSQADRLSIFLATVGPLDESRIGRWRSSMTENDLIAFEKIAGTTLSEFGYGVETAETPNVDFEEKLAELRRNAVASPGDYTVSHALGRYYLDQGKIDRGVACFQQAAGLAQQAMIEGAAANALGDDLERVENYELAWPLLARAGMPRKAAGPHSEIPEWDGSPLTGKTILVHKRIRDVGAEIRQARLLAMAQAEASACIVVTERLQKLFRRSFPGLTVLRPTDEIAAPIDWVASYETLGRHLLPTRDMIARSFVPLKASAEMARACRARYLAGTDNRKIVGLAWKSGNKNKDVPSLDDWTEALRGSRDYSVVSLQYGDAESDLRTFEANSGVEVIFDPMIDPLTDLDAAAAQIASVDLVLSVSTTAVHLAGSLGVPTILLRDDIQHLTWPLGSARSAWYPRTVIERKRNRPWRDVIAHATQMALDKLRPS